MKIMLSSGVILNVSNSSVAPGKMNSANTYSYKTGASVDIPALQSTVSDYTSWDGTSEITAQSNNDLVIVELNSSSKVVRAGKTKVTSAS